MNKDIVKKARDLNQWILQQDSVQEFQKYEYMLQNHPELKTLEENLKQLQKEIVKAKHKNQDCQNLIEEYEIMKKRFDENPIVYNYLLLKEEVNELVCQIQDDINEQLKKKVD